ncbi:radical SAM additional 4Fe4S-binding SPASM domain-containing protein [Paenibacillus sp. UNCCL117]|uniref:radical SAM/SPASM domain-containing protein n=1 Tax=unclassified Paenibacillus TaxID=185978 RepID=UPI0008855BF5|nr:MULTISPECIES: radical SAM/SPASM domain-containing protein [unclassified Paenibacillus]SDD49757.1 radical SAM additional 4Fe4S-binding SPASM domain-containing protein [Paenibacillus sp. cl123]SFW49886.1 radical SAM additional 4Fe4S-binding SPASM domain-containing protein [Paenibacillus sp. UNCCL117]
MRTFKKFYIEITSVCNLACSFCPQTKRQANFIKTDAFTKILDDIKPHTDSIYLHVKGEPLLHPKLDQLLDLAHERGFKVNITSNGTLLNKVKHKLLGHPAIRQMNFSLHSFDGHEGSVDKEGYVSMVLAFAKEAVAQSDMLVSLRLWNLTEDNIVNEERRRNRDILEMIEKEFGLDFNIEEKFKRGGGVKLAGQIYLNQDHEFKWPDLKEDEDEGKGFCHGLRNQAGVLVDGTVIPCCLDGEGVINLGNIHEQSFSEIIQGERATRIYDGFSRREVVEELCRKCGYRRRFGA